MPKIVLPDLAALRQRERLADETHVLLQLDGRVAVFEPVGPEPDAQFRGAAYRWYVGCMSGDRLADRLKAALPLLEEALAALNDGVERRKKAVAAVLESLHYRPVVRFRPASPADLAYAAAVESDDFDYRVRLAESVVAVKSWKPDLGVGLLWLLVRDLRQCDAKIDFDLLFSRASLPGHGSAAGPAGETVLAVDHRGDRLLRGLDGKLRVERAKPRRKLEAA